MLPSVGLSSPLLVTLGLLRLRCTYASDCPIAFQRRHRNLPCLLAWAPRQGKVTAALVTGLTA